MDIELLFTLLVFWLSTSMALCVIIPMMIFNEGDSFHPHAVDVDHRHSLFVVVHSNTYCKTDFVVRSISAFVAPRGSSSSKQFTVLSVMISVAGFLGTFRWYKVGDGKPLEVILALIGFASLLLVAGFELNVVPDQFLQEKLMVTGWLIEKLHMEDMLDFDVNDFRNEKFIKFIRSSSALYTMYEEDHILQTRSKGYKKWAKYNLTWEGLHILGAVVFCGFVTASIIINDINEHPVAWVTGSFFALFCILGYFTGSYVPLFRCLRCYIMLWNPFLRDPRFMYKLKLAIEEYHARITQSKEAPGVLVSSTPGSPRSKSPAGMRTRSLDMGPIGALNAHTNVNSPSRTNQMSPSRNGEVPLSPTKFYEKIHRPNAGAPSTDSPACDEIHDREVAELKMKLRGVHHDSPDSIVKGVSPVEDQSEGESAGIGLSNAVKSMENSDHDDGVNKDPEHHKVSPWGDVIAGHVGLNTGATNGVEMTQEPEIRRQLSAGRKGLKRSLSEGNKHPKDYLSKRDRELEAAMEVDKCLDNFALRFARSHPKMYLKVVGHVLVLSELIALLTPCVGMGLQWATALCDAPTVPTILDLLSLGYKCLFTTECRGLDIGQMEHCMLRETA